MQEIIQRFLCMVLCFVWCNHSNSQTIPIIIYEFDQPSLSENGWQEIPGGFDNASPGSIEALNLPDDLISTSLDQKGIQLSVDPTEIAMIFASEPVFSSGSSYLIRAKIRSSSLNASIALVALKGELSTGIAVDGSIATNIPMKANLFLHEEKWLTLVYQPDDDVPVTPLIQVASISDLETVHVWIDRVEIYPISADETLPGELFLSNVVDLTSISTNTPTIVPITPTPIPTTTNTHTLIPTQTVTPSHTPTATNTVIPTSTPTPFDIVDSFVMPLSGLSADDLPLQMNLIPTGTFMMGSPEDEADRLNDESPQHEVTISNPFYMSAYPITQAQWSALVANNPSSFTGNGNLPVDSMTWVDTLEFTQQLNDFSIGQFRLPTEAEWEYACRAGTTTRYYWGEDSTNTEFNHYAWDFFNTDGRSQVVGQKLPNPFGLFDMSGNVQEWCSDWYGEYSSESKIDPIGPISGDDRVIRGGFWGGSHGGTRSAARGHIPPHIVSNTVSFRVVMEIPKTNEPEPTPIIQTVNSTQFGANIQSFVSNAIDTESLTIMSSDHLKVIRYFAQESVSDNINKMQQAWNNGMQVIMTFGTSTTAFGIDCNIGPCTSVSTVDCCNDCWWNLDLLSFDSNTGEIERRYSCSPQGYADWIDYRISQIEQAIPGVIGNVLIGVQIGNEEEEKWGFVFDQGYSAGRSYADYYQAAEEVVRMKWPDLQLFAGSIESHRSLDFSLGGEPSRFLADNGRGARGFLNGFVQKVMDDNELNIDRLPDVIAINGYSGLAPPEYLNQGDGTKEWIQRLETLDSIFHFYGYQPRYANMEYGFSPLESSVYGPIGANAKTQAIYYLRYNLMNATMKSSRGSIWDYSFYWVHPFNGETEFDTGWFQDPNKTESSNRPIRRVGQIMHNTGSTENISLGLQGDYEVWLPAASEIGEGIIPQNNNKMTCGWIDASGQKWGAIWRYQNNIEHYYDTEPSIEEFVIDGNELNPVHLYKFMFEEPFSYAGTSLMRITETPITGVYHSTQDQTVFTLPSHTVRDGIEYEAVDENPLFLHF